MASVGDKEKRDAASRIMVIAIIFAGLSLTKYAATLAKNILGRYR